MNETEMIDLYEELVETLHELNKEAPKIKEMYTSFQKELEKQHLRLQESAKKAKADIKEAELKGTKNVSNLLNDLGALVKQAEELQNRLKISVDASERIGREINILEQAFTSQKQLIKIMHDKYTELDERISKLESGIQAFGSENMVSPVKTDILSQPKGIGISNKSFKNRLKLYTEQTIKGTENRETILKEGEVFTAEQEEIFNEEKAKAIAARKRLMEQVYGKF